MQSSQLIPVSPGTIGNIHCLTVDGRALHRALKVRRDFSNWIKKRISDYGFEEGKDYEKIVNDFSSPNLANASPNGLPPIDYKLEISMGKELCMVEKTEAGRVARRYFIECERRLLTAAPQTPTLESTTTPSTAEDRSPLRALVHAWSQASGQPHTVLWPQVKAHFQLSRIDDLPVEWIPDALAFVQGKIDGLPKALPESTPTALPPVLSGFNADCELACDRLRSVAELLDEARLTMSRHYHSAHGLRRGGVVFEAMKVMELADHAAAIATGMLRRQQTEL